MKWLKTTESTDFNVNLHRIILYNFKTNLLMVKFMLKKISLKTKLLVPTIGLLAILIIFGTIIIVSVYSKMVTLSELEGKITLSNLISNVIHSQQKERGLSSGYITYGDDTFKTELLLQRKKSDLSIHELLNYIETTSIYVKKPNVKLLEILRDKIDNNKINSQIAIEKYSALNSELLTTIVDIAKNSHVPIITQNILAYCNLLYLKENAGVQRANGVVLLSGKFNKKNMIRFSSLTILQEQNEMMFFNYASLKIHTKYENIKNSNIFKKIKNIENEIENLHSSVKPKYWYDIMTKKLDLLDSVGKFIKKDTTNKIKLELQNAQKVFAFVIMLVIVSFGIFVFLLIAFVRLATEEQRLRVVMDKYVISSITNTKGLILDVSEAFCAISGYEKNQLVGKNHNIVRHEDMPSDVYKDLWSKIPKGESWSGKVKNKRKDGSSYWVYANIEPLYNKKGKIEAYISIRLDITENELLIQKIKEEEQKNKVQEKLMQQQHRLAQMGEMINMIAHQWRQPLSAITAATGAITIKAKLNKLENKLAIDLAEKIKDFSMQLSATIDDFRNFFKSNKVKRKTDFEQLYNSVFRIVESSLKSKKIKIKTEIVAIEEFKTYDNELKQVLLNLIKNSEDALIEKNIENRYINIMIDKKTFIISDNAGGISDNIVDKIFEPYFSTKLKKDGTGLGLYMSKLIVEEHCKGMLSVKNSEDGAVFKIIIGEDND